MIVRECDVPLMPRYLRLDSSEFDRWWLSVSGELCVLQASRLKFGNIKNITQGIIWNNGDGILQSRMDKWEGVKGERIYFHVQINS